jgi:parallel beta-helix repeat protein
MSKQQRTSGWNKTTRSALWLAAFLLFQTISIPRIVEAAVLEPKGFDSASLSATLQQATSGDTIQLPTGTFELTEPLRLKSGVKLIGAGQEKTCLIYRGTQPSSLIQISDSENIEVAHLTLDGQDNPRARDGLTGDNSNHLLIHDVTFRNLGKDTPSFSHGILFSGRNPTCERGVTDSVIRDCRFERIGLKAEYGGAIRLQWGCVRNRVEGNVVRDTGRGGIFGDHSAELTIRHNQVSGSGGEGLGIEIWGGCPRSLIEDNVVDHWISVDQGHQSAIRRNVVGSDDGSLKYIGIEVIAQNVVVTDNVVNQGAAIGLSVSNNPVKSNVFWGYNTIRDCAEWGGQFQGDQGGIAHHYFYRCNFEKTIHGDSRVRYPEASGHGLRFNGSVDGVEMEECAFRDNAAAGVQFCGENVDRLTFRRCTFSNNRQGAFTGLSPEKTVGFKDNTMADTETLPSTRAFTTPQPTADFRLPEHLQADKAGQFECISKPGTGEITERLWDFGEGIPETEASPRHTFNQPGRYRVTLVVWDAGGRGARMEKTIEVLPGQ